MTKSSKQSIESSMLRIKQRPKKPKKPKKLYTFTRVYTSSTSKWDSKPPGRPHEINERQDKIIALENFLKFSFFLCHCYSYSCWHFCCCCFCYYYLLYIYLCCSFSYYFGFSFVLPHNFGVYVFEQLFIFIIINSLRFCSAT